MNLFRIFFFKRYVESFGHVGICWGYLGTGGPGYVHDYVGHIFTPGASEISKPHRDASGKMVGE